MTEDSEGGFFSAELRKIFNLKETPALFSHDYSLSKRCFALAKQA